MDWSNSTIGSQRSLFESCNAWCDDIYVLYANGDEASLISMEDMMTGIKTSITRDKRPGKSIMLPDTLLLMK